MYSGRSVQQTEFILFDITGEQSELTIWRSAPIAKALAVVSASAASRRNFWILRSALAPKSPESESESEGPESESKGPESESEGPESESEGPESESVGLESEAHRPESESKESPHGVTICDLMYSHLLPL